MKPYTTCPTCKTMYNTELASECPVCKYGIEEDKKWQTVTCECCGKKFPALKKSRRRFCSKACTSTKNKKLTNK